MCNESTWSLGWLVFEKTNLNAQPAEDLPHTTLRLTHKWTSKLLILPRLINLQPFHKSLYRLNHSSYCTVHGHNLYRLNCNSSTISATEAGCHCISLYSKPKLPLPIKCATLHLHQFPGVCTTALLCNKGVELWEMQMFSNAISTMVNKFISIDCLCTCCALSDNLITFCETWKIIINHKDFNYVKNKFWSYLWLTWHPLVTDLYSSGGVRIQMMFVVWYKFAGDHAPMRHTAHI